MKLGRISTKIRKTMGKVTRLVRNLSIYKRLIISFLLIITIPNFLIGYYSFSISSNEMVKKISSSSTQALKSVEFNIKDKLKLYESLAHQINHNEKIRFLLKECRSLKKENDVDSKKKYDECKIQIGQLLSAYTLSNDSTNLEIITEDDEFRPLSYNNGTKVGARLKDVSNYRKRASYLKTIKLEGWPVWTDTSRESGVFQVQPIGNTNLGNYLTLSSSIQEVTDDKPLGVIIMTVPTIIFLNMVNLQNMYDANEVVFLAGKDGIISIINGKYIFNMPDKLIINEIIAMQDGTFVRTIGNKEYILAFGASGTSDMVIAYMVERGKALNTVYKVRNIIIEITVGCILCAMFLAYFVTSSISKPLNRLKKTMESVEEKGLELEYEDDSKDEIGVLGHRFNNMLAGIKSLMNDVIDMELSRKNEEIRRRQAELDALQMQIKDHFIYNTLDLIRWNAMFIENGNGSLSKMIEDFSTFLRFSTKKANKLVDMNEEIEHVYAYLKVVQFKKEIKFDVKLDIEDEVILHSKITKLTFQPIVENALKHGLLDIHKQLVISIRPYIANGDLFVEIRDNGVGIHKEKVDKLNDELQKEDYTVGSIGLRNVNERIKLSFGREFGLKMYSKEGEYTTIIIHIPNIF